MVELAKIAADAIVKELEDKKKATRKYLSITNSAHSWRECSAEAKTKLLRREATNDRSEAHSEVPLIKFRNMGVLASQMQLR